MEHLATAIGMDPLEFRLKNMMDSSQGVPNPLPSSIIPELMTSSNYEERKKQVEEFNAVREIGSLKLDANNHQLCYFSPVVLAIIFTAAVKWVSSAYFIF